MGPVAPLRRRLVLGALVVALGAGLVAGLAPGRGQPTASPDFDEAVVAAAAASEPGDRVRAAVEGLRRTGFYVGPELRGRLTTDEMSTIERLIAEAPVPVHVVWWEDTHDAGYSTAYAALDQVRAGVDRPGYYAIVTSEGDALTGSIGYQDPYVEVDAKGRPGPALVRYVSALVAVPPERQDGSSSGGGDGGDYWGGPGGGIAAGLLFAGGGYLILLLVVGVTGSVVARRRAAG